MGPLASVPVFFGLRVASALLLLKLSATFLPVSSFAVFTQLMIFAALINLMAVGGVQNGLIRQAAAASDAEGLARTQNAAFLIWASVLPVLITVVFLGSEAISHILVGTKGEWEAVIVITLLVLAAGPGQIWCSILSGRKRIASSLGAQAAGLLASTVSAAWLITQGRPVAATLAFASGGLVTMAVSFVLAGRLRIPMAPSRSAVPEVRTLLRYSAAFAATTGFTSVVLFGLRWLYRESFGPVELGYWMAANRISDMSTQLLGLFMIQFFVPHLAMGEDEAARRSLILRSWALGAAIMATILVVFSLASGPLVHLFLSDAYLPAIPAIRAYMTGDFLRVWPSLAMYAAFASGRPGRYAAIEIGTLGIMAAITVVLVSAGDMHAPLYGYAGAYAVAALLVSGAFIWRSYRLSAPSPPHDARQTPREGRGERPRGQQPGSTDPLQAAAPPAGKPLDR